ncbi:hypothetical protein MOE47_09500 [Bacillus atrophaeus]|uniref:hypothetical protein n=1 Tax=Bacillus atrophaeus TaxID=1452 RepID=UPI00227FFC94|nr:hypothetical protein [Bacillus atrophaeus]MCY8914280.1 hypothetical protein [Bacillus atrophaeus]MCY9114642.1 hypothetical protein [Bacillus atrophaeus]MEC0924138.1 hypothetical protein [Bacillus atrophaeus]MEC0932749.1 hypothetical protein [Bacillus atrophaeus]
MYYLNKGEEGFYSPELQQSNYKGDLYQKNNYSKCNDTNLNPVMAYQYKEENTVKDEPIYHFSRPIKVQRGVQNIIGVPVRKIEYEWGPMHCDQMENKYSKLIVFSNGTFQTSNILKDHSGHRKYGNSLTYNIVFPSDSGSGCGSQVCTILNFNANFSPGEEKPYAYSGSNNQCIEVNFPLLEKNELIPCITWSCWHRYR